jgi:flagellar basal-body rod protein FlgB
MDIVFDSSSAVVAEMIRATAQRHQVLAANLANIETPGYQAQEVSFASALDQAQGAGSPDPRPLQVRTTVVPDPDALPRRDGNSVDLDRQMVKLAQNTLWHTGLIQILNSRFAMIRAAIRDRG